MDEAEWRRRQQYLVNGQSVVGSTPSTTIGSNQSISIPPIASVQQPWIRDPRLYQRFAILSTQIPAISAPTQVPPAIRQISSAQNKAIRPSSSMQFPSISAPIIPVPSAAIQSISTTQIRGISKVAAPVARPISQMQIQPIYEPISPVQNPSKTPSISSTIPVHPSQQLLINSPIPDDLPVGWFKYLHKSGVPVYFHKASLVCSFSRPYFIGPISITDHDVPISAIPCYERKVKMDEANGIQRQNTNSVKIPKNLPIFSGPIVEDSPWPEDFGRQNMGAREIHDYCWVRFGFKSSVTESALNNQRKRPVAAISANETTDDGPENIMIFKEIIKVPIPKRKKSNEDGIENQSIVASSGSIVSENPASLINQFKAIDIDTQGHVIAKISQTANVASENLTSSIDQPKAIGTQGQETAKMTEHEKILKSLSQMGCNITEGQLATGALSEYVNHVLNGNVFYNTVHTGSGYTATVNIHCRSTEKEYVCGTGHGNGVNHAKKHAAKDAMIKFFPNIQIGASCRILPINSSLVETIGKLQVKSEEIIASENPMSLIDDQFKMAIDIDSQSHMIAKNSQIANVASENSTSSIDQSNVIGIQDQEAAKINEHEAILEYLSQLGCNLRSIEGQSVRVALAEYVQRVLHGHVVYEVLPNRPGYRCSVTANILCHSTGQKTVCGNGHGHSGIEAKNIAAKVAMINFFPNIQIDDSYCILPIKSNQLEMVGKSQANPGIPLQMVYKEYR